MRSILIIIFQVFSIAVVAQNNIKQKHAFIDLGLPSKTLWATMNIGASAPEQVGSFFAWGEVKTKKEYSWKTYKYSKRDSSKFLYEEQLTKYCTREKEGIVDNRQELEPMDDAATVNWGTGWRMPSLEQWKELCNKCEWKRITLPNKRKIYRVTGPNGNVLILPCGGEFLGRGLINIVGEAHAQYWSRTLDTYMFNSSADCMHNGNTNQSSDRDNGLLVRAVYEP